MSEISDVEKTSKIINDTGSFTEKAMYLELLEQRILIQSLKVELDELKSLICRKVGSQND